MFFVMLLRQMLIYDPGRQGPGTTMIEVDANSSLLLGLETHLHQILDLNAMVHMRDPQTQKGEEYTRQPGRLQLASGAGRDPGDPSAMNEEGNTAMWTLPCTMRPMKIGTGK